MRLKSPTPVYRGPFGPAEAERLLWRAGFGPKRGQAGKLAKLGLHGAVASLTRPTGPTRLRGPKPRVEEGRLLPYDAEGHDHLYWLDRMVRSTNQLEERMALNFHDWFATSLLTVKDQRRMINQYRLFRRHATGNFGSLLREVTRNPAMLHWLNGIENQRKAPNENYAREAAELFSLGADRGAYTEQDVRELARCFTGWTATYKLGSGWTNFRFNEKRHDQKTKVVFGQSGRFDWRDACRLCLEHPMHASFFVEKLWSYFMPEPLGPRDLAKLERRYRDSGHQIRPIIEAILLHPSLYEGPPMVKQPVVLVAGMLRGMGRGIETEAWVSICGSAGQRLFVPPNVGGWNHDNWLHTGSIRARFRAAATALDPITQRPRDAADQLDEPALALRGARRAVGVYRIGAEPTEDLLDYAARLESDPPIGRGGPRARNADRENALRQLILAGPENQVD